MTYPRRPAQKLNEGPAIRAIAPVAPGSEIPRILHQTYQSRDLSTELQLRMSALIEGNPGWEHRFYDDRDIDEFIAREYGSEILLAYRRIDPEYGAARADLFRYLVMYKVGGVYIDIKSGAAKPLEQIVSPSDHFVLSKWRNAPGEPHAGFGIHSALAALSGGEFQQWYLAARPGHPFLKAVIERVLTNIDAYRPWRHGVGRYAVLAVTGPIAYTLAIQPLLALHPHRLEADERSVGFVYSNMLPSAHEMLFTRHYSRSRRPVVAMDRGQRLIFLAFRVKRKLARWLRARRQRVRS